MAGSPLPPPPTAALPAPRSLPCSSCGSQPPNYELFTGGTLYRLGDMFAVGRYRRQECNVRTCALVCSPDAEQNANCTGMRRCDANATCDPSSCKPRNVREYHLLCFPDSLASRYMRATIKENDYRLLAQLISERNACLAPPRHAVVVHLRLGDVVDAPSWKEPNATDLPEFSLPIPQLLQLPDDVCRRAGTRWCHVKTLPYYQRQQNKLPASVRRAVLVAGSHVRMAYYPRSSEYLNGVRDFFLSQGYEVELRLGQPPDDDVVYMSRAAYFIPGGGGYAIVLAGIVSHMGGVVLDDGDVNITDGGHGVSHGGVGHGHVPGSTGGALGRAPSS